MLNSFLLLTGNISCFDYLVSLETAFRIESVNFFTMLSMIQICSNLLVRMLNTLKHLSLFSFSVFRKLHYIINLNYEFTRNRCC